MKKRIFAWILAIALVIGIMPAQAYAAINERANYGYGIPPENGELWKYVGKSLATDAASTWMRGNTYIRDGKNGMPLAESYNSAYTRENLIWQTKDAYIQGAEKLKQDKWLQDTKIFILYLPNCGYSKASLPQWQQIAGDAGVQVGLVDVFTYRTASLLFFYDSANQGASSSIVLYIDKDGNLKGRTGVHSNSEFVEILHDAGYTTAQDPNAGNETKPVYSKVQQYKDQVLNETNRQRIARGLLPLSTFTALETAADKRAEEIVSTPTHERPDGTMYTTLMNFAWPNWAGENLCAGPAVATPLAAMNAWMNSKPHRANILSENYTHMSVGYYENKDTSKYKYKDHWIQLFTGKCEFDSMTLSQNQISVQKGVPISDMNITVNLTCKTHGTSTMPLIDEMVTGYNANVPGEQNVTVHYGDKNGDKFTAQLLVTVGNVEPTDLTEDMVKLSATEFTYDGREQKPTVTVSNPTGLYTLMEDYSYTVEYSDNINAGTATVTVKGKGNYRGTVTKTFTIKQKDLSSMKDEKTPEFEVSGIEKEYNYTGKAIQPTVTVKNGTKVLYEGKDFTVTYGEGDNKNIGDYDVDSKTLKYPNGIVTISGKGNYTGTIKREFSISVKDLQNLINFKNVFNTTINFANQLKKIENPTASVSDVYEACEIITQARKDLDKGIIPEMIHPSTGQPIPSVNVDLNIRSAYTVVESLYSSLNKKETAGALEELLTTDLLPEVKQMVLDYYRFYAELKGIKVEEQVAPPTSSVEEVKNVSISGLESSLANTVSTAALTIEPMTEEMKKEVTVDAKKYDTVAAVPMEINLELTSKDGSSDAKLQTPVTITMDVPENLKSENNTDSNLVMLHYKDGANSEPEVLPVTVNNDGTFSFSVSSFSPFVLTKALPQYEVNDSNVPANDPEITGVTFGTEADQTDEDAKLPSPQNVSSIFTTIKEGDTDVNVMQVTWDEVAVNTVKTTKSYKVEGYEVEWSASPDMTDSRTLEVDADTTTANIKGLSKGLYYVQVSAIIGTVDSTTSSKGASLNRTYTTSNKTVLDWTVEASEADKVTAVGSKSAEGNVEVTNIDNGKVTVKVTPADGYKLKSLIPQEDGGNVLAYSATGTENEYTFMLNQKNVTVNAVFEKLPEPVKYYSVTTNSTVNGKVNVKTTSTTAKSKVEIEVTPDEGYKLNQLLVTPVTNTTVDVKEEEASIYSFIMPESNVTVSATFTKESNDNNNNNNNNSGNTVVDDEVVIAPTKTDIAKATISSLESKAYTGQEITQSFSVTYNGQTLVENTDYTVSYKNNINAGTATVTITGTGNYTGVLTKEFTITPASLAGYNVANIANKTYTGKAIKPAVTVKNGTTKLVENTDYTVSYKNNTKVGTATVTITGKGNYTGTLTKTFTIKRASIKNMKVSAIANQVYTGKLVKPSVTVKNGTTTLKAGTDYTLTYKNNRKVGTAKVVITGKGNYTGTKTVSFKISNKAISKATVSIKKTQYAYTGKAIKPAVTVKFNNKTLKKGVDYTVAYSNNTKVGTAKITITGKGAYAGTKTVKFKIVKK